MKKHVYKIKEWLTRNTPQFKQLKGGTSAVYQKIKDGKLYMLDDTVTFKKEGEEVFGRIIEFDKDMIHVSVIFDNAYTREINEVELYNFGDKLRKAHEDFVNKLRADIKEKDRIHRESQIDTDKQRESYGGETTK